MSSVLPDPTPPGYRPHRSSYRHDRYQNTTGRAAFGQNGGAPVYSGPNAGVLGNNNSHRSGLMNRRAPFDRGVKRTTECPCAVRLYHLSGNDIAARSEFCSIVLGAPSVGINEAVRVGVLPSNKNNSNSTITSEGLSQISTRESENKMETMPSLSPSSSSAVARPIAVQLAWGDTTVWEVAHTALRAVRADVDAAYKAEQRRNAYRVKVSGVNSLFDGTSGKGTALTEEEGKSCKSEVEEDNGDKADALYSTPPHRYEVELLTGSVNSLGQASIIPLCTVACRQVLPGHASLLPVRTNGSLDYNTALYELMYNLGDPVFVTCKRTL